LIALHSIAIKRRLSYGILRSSSWSLPLSSDRI
jgi:hypothetical protein